MTAEHAACHIRRYADETGHVASCGCGWRTTHNDLDTVTERITEHLERTPPCAVTT